MRRFISLFTVLMLCGVLAFTQSRVVSGTVTDESGVPVPGASVKIKGSNTGTSADSRGNFQISVSPGSSLIFSGVGLTTQEVGTTNQSVINASMIRSSAELSNVIVTALGISRSKNTLPYAATKVEGSNVNQTRNSNFVTNLSGKVAGLEIKQGNSLGGSTNVLLRGFKSLTGNSQALFVVDGVPFDNSNNNTTDQTTGRGGFDYGSAAADVNPDDIESISVLKGAAASALYGSRGFNGVILITTKKGKRGFSVTVNSGITYNSILKNTFPTYQKKYGEGYGQYYGTASGYLDSMDVNGDGVSDLVAPTYDDASYGEPLNPNLLVYQWSSFDPSSPNFGKPLPYVGAANDPTTFFEKPLSFNNSIFLEGGSDKGSFALGLTRNDEKGVLPNSSLNKNLLNFTSTYKLNDKLTAGASANYSSIAGKGRYGTGYDGANALNPMTTFREWWAVTTDIKEQKAAYERTGANITWNPKLLPGQLQPSYWDNPYFLRYQNVENDSRNRYFGNVSLTYNPISWLNVVGRISLDSYEEQEEERKAITSVGVPYYRRFNRRYSEINYDLIANGNFDLTHDLNFRALLGGNIRQQKTSSIDAITNGGLVVPNLYVLSNSANIPLPPVEFQSTRRIEGVFAGGTFTYKNTYILDGTIRRDRSSTLPKENNVFYYPSISAGIVFSELAKQRWLSYGKLRANYAEVGNDAPVFNVNDTYVHDIDPNSGSEVSSYDGNTLFSVSGTKKNQALKPERTKSLEFGLEASFLKSRVGFDITYYNAKTINQIIPVTVSAATGYRKKVVNSGAIRNKGIELSVNGTPLKSSNFSWDINVNYTRNRNEVLELYSGVDNIILGTFQGSLTINASLHEPYGTIHGSDYTYLNGQKIVNADNGRYVKSSTNNITIGNINPDWIGGVTNKFSYKGFALSFLIDVKQGGDVFSTDLYYGLSTGIYPETAANNDLGNPIRSAVADGGGLIRPGVNPDGKVNATRASAVNYGGFGYRYAPDAAFVYDASYVKLREASLGYSFPKKMFNNGVIKGVDLSVIGRNLWIIHKNLPYADPEEGFSSGNLQGIQTGAYPSVRSIAFNVKVKL